MPSNVDQWEAQRKEWAEKAVEGYKKAQERKWRNWDEIMFKTKLT